MSYIMNVDDTSTQQTFCSLFVLLPNSINNFGLYKNIIKMQIVNVSYRFYK